jgi:hypothetical protein
MSRLRHRLEIVGSSVEARVAVGGSGWAKQIPIAAAITSSAVARHLLALPPCSLDPVFSER